MKKIFHDIISKYFCAVKHVKIIFPDIISKYFCAVKYFDKNVPAL